MEEKKLLTEEELGNANGGCVFPELLAAQPLWIVVLELPDYPNGASE